MLNVNKNEKSKYSEKIQNLTDNLQQGLNLLLSSDKFKAYLNMQTKFYTYSVSNVILICMQRPDATYVTGYKTWQNDFNRFVLKGEKGIEIIAPIFHKKKKAKKISDADVESKDEAYTSYRIVYVYDIKQTGGKEFPQIKISNLNGRINEYPSLVTALVELSPVPVHIKEITDTKALGRYIPMQGIIEIRTHMSQKQTIKTMLHEIAHAKSYELLSNISDFTYEQKEILAESVAYIVSNYLGIDTSEYSFKYVALWGGKYSLNEFKQLLNAIQLLSHVLIEAYEKRKGCVLNA